MTMLPLIECGEMLTIDPKTLRHWVQQAHLSLSPHPGDARVKCLTMEQVQHLAALHGRALKLHETLATTPVVDSSAPRAPQVPLHPEPAGRGVPELSSPVQPDADLSRKLSHLEMTVAALQQQLAQLTVELLHERERRSDQRLVTVEALIQQAFGSHPLPQALPQSAGSAPPDGKPGPHPAERRGRPLLPLIEYGAGGTYVVICPVQGELQLTPDTSEWFLWLASLASFRFVGKCGRFTACRVFHKGPTRSWQAYRVIHQRRYKPYLGVTECLTIACLEQAAATLQSHLE